MTVTYPDHPAATAHRDVLAALRDGDNDRLRELADVERFELTIENGVPDSVPQLLDFGGMTAFVDGTWRPATPPVGSAYGFMECVELVDVRVVDNNTVVVKHQMTIRHTGPFAVPEGPTIPASGRLVTLEVEETVTVDDSGKVVGWTTKLDMPRFLADIS